MMIALCELRIPACASAARMSVRARPPRASPPILRNSRRDIPSQKRVPSLPRIVSIPRSPLSPRTCNFHHPPYSDAIFGPLLRISFFVQKKRWTTQAQRHRVMRTQSLLHAWGTQRVWAIMKRRTEHPKDLYHDTPNPHAARPLADDRPAAGDRVYFDTGRPGRGGQEAATAPPCPVR